MTVYQNAEHPVAVEEIKADAGMDIGDTLIGMQLKRVAVPVRISVKKIGEANVVCARTRPKFIGGSPQSTTMSYPAEISKGNGSGSMEEVSRVIIA